MRRATKEIEATKGGEEVNPVHQTQFATADAVPCEWEIDNEAYHSDQQFSVSHSDSELYAADTNLYYRKNIAKTWQRKKTRALDIGTLFHDVVLGLPYLCDATNFRQHTIALYDVCRAPDRPPDAVSDSGSQYWFDGKGVTRSAGHWGRVASNHWELRGPVTAEQFATGRCEWGKFIYDTGDFRPIPSDVLNKDGHRKGAAWTEWSAIRPDLPALKATEEEDGWAVVPEMLSAIRGHYAANQILFELEGQNEVAIRSIHKPSGLMIRGRLDAPRNHTVLGDLKSIRGGYCDPESFSRYAYSAGYHRQAAWYQDLWFDLHGERLPFVFIVVDKTSFRVEAHELDAKFIELGRRENDAVLMRMAESFRTGKFRSQTHGRVVTISAPRWATYQSEWEYSNEQ